MENQKKIEMLGSYQLTSELSSQNSGFSVWGYGKKKKFIARGATVFAKKPIDLLDILK